MGYQDRRLDLVVASHGPSPEGLPFVLRRYDIASLLYPKVPFPDDQAFEAWQEQMRARNVSFAGAQAGMRVDLGGGATVEALNPPLPPFSSTTQDVGSNAVVLRATQGRVSFLIAGDVRPLAQRSLVELGAPLGSAVLVIQGLTRLDDAFLAAAEPALIVITGQDVAGEPAIEAVTASQVSLRPRGSPYRVMNIAGRGPATLKTDGQRLRLE